MREYESKIRKHIPVDKLRELLNKPGDNTPPSKDDPDSYSSDKSDDTRDPDLDKLDLLSGFNVNSSEKVAWLLFDILGLGRGKSLKTSGDGKRISTGKKQLEMLKDEHEVVGLLLKYREVSKLKTTSCSSFNISSCFLPVEMRLPSPEVFKDLPRPKPKMSNSNHATFSLLFTLKPDKRSSLSKSGSRVSSDLSEE
jgi:hypothetical protein